ncbi:MAG: pseudouridine synthase [Alphaproteobacteria bacterium]
MTDERIAKVMARAGLCSRRDAERWIEDGRVMLDGEILRTPAVKVSVEKNDIRVDGKRLGAPDKARVWLYYKPVGLVVTNYDPEGRRTIYDDLPRSLPRVMSVGRLDINTEGLILLTNDGDLARKLEHPDTGLVREYRVRVYGDVHPSALRDLEDGVTIDGVRYASIVARFEQQKSQDHGKRNRWLRVSLVEGKNREIRCVMEYLGLQVSRLMRISYGDFELGSMKHSQLIEAAQRDVLKI